MQDALLARLGEIVGDANVRNDPASREAYGQDWTRFHVPEPVAVVFVSDVQQVVELVGFARAQKISLVPSGGRTGLSGGACATKGELVVSFDKMNQVVAFSPEDSSVTVQAGVITAQLQNYAIEKGLYYPVDFASSGSSQIGGNIATNAGGIRVLRYGLTRDQVSGLKVVTGNGDLLSLNQGLIKNSTGYDLRHLFIGSEGTLGFIVEATIQLIKPALNSSVMLLAVPRLQDVLPILSAFRQKSTLNAFEFFSQNALNHVLQHSSLKAPFADPADYYVLLEFENESERDFELATQAFAHCLDCAWAVDGVISTSHRQSQQFWQYRERISESITPHSPYKNDISVRISAIPAALDAIDELVNREYPEFEIVWFGHIGDGNLHLNILKPASWELHRFKAECEVVSNQVLGLVQHYHGSISAEHGVGLLKRDQLHFCRTPEEITAMRAIKQIFDPDGIMNPGKLL